MTELRDLGIQIPDISIFWLAVMLVISLAVLPWISAVVVSKYWNSFIPRLFPSLGRITTKDAYRLQILASLLAGSGAILVMLLVGGILIGVEMLLH